MKKIFTALFFPLAFICNGQPGLGSNIFQWYKGEIIFSNGDTVVCTLRYLYDATNNLLQIQYQDQTVTLTTQEVTSFRYYDDDHSKWRNFISMTLDSISDGRRVFLQTLYKDDNITILSHRTVDVRYEYMRYLGLFAKPSRLSKKYILDSEGHQLLPLSKENALNLVSDKKPEVEQFIRSNHLRFKRTGDYIALFKFHNSL